MPRRWPYVGSPCRYARSSTRWCGTTDSVFWLEPPLPHCTRSDDPADLLGKIPSNWSRQYDAPALVRKAAPVLVDRIFGSCAAKPGVMRTPAGGKAESGADERIVM